MFGGSLYLDIGEGRVRILKGALRHHAFRIDSYSSLDFSHPLGRDLDDERNYEIGNQLAGFLKERGLRSRRVSVLLSREGIITRTTRVPALDNRLLQEFIHAAINEFLPVDLNEYAYDYRVMRSVTGGDDKSYYDLLLGAVPRFMVEQVLQIMEVTGLYINSIDILPNALLRLFATLPYNDVAVLDVCPDGSRIAILEDKSLLLYADIPFHLWSEEEDGQDFGVLLDETRGYLNFFAARHQGQPVEALYVVGDMASRPHLTASFGSVLGLPVKTSLDDVLTCRWAPRTPQPPGWAAAAVARNLGMMLRKD